jgi:hypothetical protein
VDSDYQYFNMAIDRETLETLVRDELGRTADARVTTHIRSLLIEPTPASRDWDYGVKGQQYVCWNVLEHRPSNTAIAYCQNGFGPKAPWGLVALEGPHMSMGMDSGWFTTFLQAYFESVVATVLPIWRVFKTDPSGQRLPITPEGGWDETWKQVMWHREDDSTSRYDCDTSITSERE